MANQAQKMPTSLRVVTSLFVILWFLLAAFPFFWTLWGSFKVELDFFSIADWTNAITGERTEAVYGTLSQPQAMKAHGFRKNSGAMLSIPGSFVFS